MSNSGKLSVSILSKQQFFETMPQVKHEVEVTNPKTGVTSKVMLEGMNSFF